MCGRFALDADVDDLIPEFVADGGDFRAWRPAYSIAPTNTVPVIRRHLVDGVAGERVVEGAKGDWPQPVGAPRRAPIINARFEKVCIPN